MAQIGFVGLGRMGANMVTRIRRDFDHGVVGYDHDAAAVARVAQATGATPADSLADLVGKLDAPRMVWIMVPAGAPTQGTVDELTGLLDAGDMIVDGGNSKWTDDKARAAVLEAHEIGYVDVGTSGGVWTIEDAIARDVPTPVITASLYARFYSRGNGDFTHRMLAALRAQFGGHPTKKAADG